VSGDLLNRWTGPARGGGRAALDAAASFLPLAFGIPVAIGAVGALVDLAGADPAGDKGTIDAAAFFLGQPLFHDPASAYASTVYPPLLPVIGGLLNHIHLWRGWVPLVTFLASLAAAALAGWVAYQPRGRAGIAAAAEAFGIGALAWWLVEQLDQPFFWNDRPDQLAWTLALAGLLAAPAGARGSNRAAAASVILLSAAVWSKQTAVVAALALVLWLTAEAARSTIGRARVAAMVASLVALNVGALGVANVLTDGWQWRLNVLWPAQQPCCEISSHFPAYLHRFATELASDAFFALLFCLAVGAVLLLGSTGRPSARPRPTRSERDLGWLLGTFTLLALTAAVRERWNIGAAQNQDLGFVWGATLLGVLGYRVARRTPATRQLALAPVLLVLVGSQAISNGTLRLPGTGHRLALPGFARDVAPLPLRPHAGWSGDVPPQLAAYARSRHVYHPDVSDLSVRSGEVYPSAANLLGDLYVGHEPAYLARAILDRRFAAVWLFSPKQVAHPLTSGNGAYEENYLWKLNQAMLLEYRPSPTVPDAGRARIAGPDPAPWLRRCWGPYRVDGIVLQQHRGGGFWCPAGSALRLFRTPAALSEVRTTAPLRSAAGWLVVTLPRHRGGFEAALRTGTHAEWSAAGRLVAGDRLRVVVRTARGSRTTTVPGHSARLAVGAGPLPTGTRLALAATRGSGARFDLSRLALR
jgi:hypothetical protein